MSDSFIRLYDVCLVVKDLHKDAGNPNAPVKVGSVVSVLESRLGRSTGRPFKINIECRNWIANQLSGMLFRYTDHADIFYSASQNICWSRFVVCKELSHLLLDTDAKHFTKDPKELVQGIVTQVPKLSPDHDLASENVAPYCAIEILLPWHLRPEMQKMMEAGKSDYDIAVHFRAPENIVNLMLRSPYAKISKHANSPKP